MHKQKQEERKRKVIESFGAIFLPHLGRTFPLIKPLNWWWGEELKGAWGLWEDLQGEQERIEADSGF